jgi:ribulose-5-phosphate 4-epimerase/fuculose-1-phosphate aldolase
MSANLKFKSTPVRERVSKEEWEMRVNLAAAYQLGALYKWTDLIYTHFSARVPGTEDFLINPYGMMFDEITASNLVKIDLDGKIVDDPLDMGVNEAGFVIHSCMHAARPEINCVIHTHTRAGVAVSVMKCGLLPISQHAMRVQPEITYHDYEGVALYKEEQERMARDLGKKSKACSRSATRCARRSRSCITSTPPARSRSTRAPAGCTTCSSCRTMRRRNPTIGSA